MKPAYRIIRQQTNVNRLYALCISKISAKCVENVYSVQNEAGSLDGTKSISAQIQHVREEKGKSIVLTLYTRAKQGNSILLQNCQQNELQTVVDNNTSDTVE